MEQSANNPLSPASEAHLRHLILKNKKRAFLFFNQGAADKPSDDLDVLRQKIDFKVQGSFANIGATPNVLVEEAKRQKVAKGLGVQMQLQTKVAGEEEKLGEGQQQEGESDIRELMGKREETGGSLEVAIQQNQNAIAIRQRKVVRPKWHAPWKLMRVISGHVGWVRAIAVDPMNKFFVSGSNDRTIKFWDLVSGSLKLTLTGHIGHVRGLIVSDRHPYLFSCGEDKQIKCWDLEQNKVVRHYHGHLNGVYCITMHPELDLLVTGGRDATARVWDLRTKKEVFVLGGHMHTVEDVACQADEPQILTASHDTTVRMWDVRTGRTLKTLTHHKKGVRALAVHPQEYTFASAGSDKIRIWKCPEGYKLRNMDDHNAVINKIAINHDNVLVSGGDNGSLYFFDWASGYCFQQHKTIVQPGSLSCEAGIFDIKFDRSGLRMITAECDKTIKIWKEDENATEESHPINFVPK